MSRSTKALLSSCRRPCESPRPAGCSASCKRSLRAPPLTYQYDYTIYNHSCDPRHSTGGRLDLRFSITATNYNNTSSNFLNVASALCACDGTLWLPELIARNANANDGCATGRIEASSRFPACRIASWTPRAATTAVSARVCCSTKLCTTSQLHHCRRQR